MSHTVNEIRRRAEFFKGQAKSADERVAQLEAQIIAARQVAELAWRHHHGLLEAARVIEKAGEQP